MTMRQVWLLTIAISLISISSNLRAQEDVEDQPEYDEQIDICILGETETRFDYTYEEQIEGCTRWSEYEGQFAEAIYFRAMLYHFDLGDWQKAIDDYSSVIAADEAHAGAYFNRGRLTREHLDDFDSALVDFTQAIDLTQEDPRPRYFLHRAYVLFTLAGIDLDDTSFDEARHDVELTRAGKSDLERFLQLTEGRETSSALEAQAIARNYITWLEPFFGEID